MSYIELHAASAFSFLRGASLPETLIERAAALGYPAIALLDRDGVYGAPRFHLAAKAAGIRAIIGAELTITSRRHALSGAEGSQPALAQSKGRQSTVDRSAASNRLTRYGGVCRRPSTVDVDRVDSARDRPSTDDRPWPLGVLVASQEGWRNLCRLITRMKLRAPKGEGALTLGDFEGHTRGLIALAGRPLLAADRYGVGGLLDRLIGVFGRDQIYVELQRHLRRDQEDDNDTLAALADAFCVPIVATGGVRFAAPEQRPLFDVLTAIREHTTLDAAGRLLAANAERYLKAPVQMARLFADRPEAVTATEALAERLQFTMNDLGYQFPRYPVPPGETEISFLRKIADIGARERYRPVSRPRASADCARARFDREAGACRLLPDRLGCRQLLPAAGHPGAGTRVGRQ